MLHRHRGVSTTGSTAKDMEMSTHVRAWHYLPYLDTMHEHDRQTGTGRQQRPRLRIALRGTLMKTEDIMQGQWIL